MKEARVTPCWAGGLVPIVKVAIWPEWRNWQTRQVEGLVAFTGSAGSSPVSGIEGTFTFPTSETVNVPFSALFCDTPRHPYLLTFGAIRPSPNQVGNHGAVRRAYERDLAA